MRIAIVTDAWFPQVNGVVRTLDKTINLLKQWGHEILCINPGLFRTMPMPTYPDIPLSLFPYGRVKKLLDEFQPDAIHLSTEGPLGWAGRRYCLKHNHPYTTTYHTRFPEYVRLRAPIPLSLSYAFVRAFHGKATLTMVATSSMKTTLESHGFKNLEYWTRGVDIEHFVPIDKPVLDLPHPIALYLGRVAVEKNITDFLDLKMPGSKVVIGDGPALDSLKQDYPQAQFLGYRKNGDLARLLASADVMVFPSRTDTFGLVMLEAMACGVPVATYPVEGPLDVIKNGNNGWMDEDLQSAVSNALEVDRKSCRAFAEGYSWEACTQQFLNLVKINLTDPVAEPTPAEKSL
ncbi:glycosyltransferase family 4 protein [Candidatus Thiodiazotropha sp. CDECU1]|uniref:glycosyltransferase family 4 protein n=1 Tax=Candidatus Thiodiazotropha sp. CDECU1 TaxID=3065865 RepID=UPI00292F669B|nr:glycosyltransferase family 1 protein [Candidatus Thiodiazotropha sp. CDECU1]